MGAKLVEFLANQCAGTALSHGNQEQIEIQFGQPFGEHQWTTASLVPGHYVDHRHQFVPGCF